jgi:hypothetical protein
VAGRRNGRSRSSRDHPDGKAAIGVPPGWRISGWGNGAVDVAGPQGQMVDVGIYLPIFSAPTYGGPIPGAVYLPLIADPAQAVRAVSEVQGRQAMARGGQGFTDIQVVEGVATPPPTGSGRPPTCSCARASAAARISTLHW